MIRPSGLRPSSLRRPAYTGQNRCWPCTAVNLVVLAVLVAAVAVFRPGVAALVGLGGVLAVWLRGYVVPYTPRFAPRLVAWLPGDVFEQPGPSDSLGDLDPADPDGEAVLRALVTADVVVTDRESLALAEGFAATWEARMDDLAASPDRALLEEVRAVTDDVATARIEDAGSEAYLVLSGRGGSTAWLRRPVAIAEIAAARALADTGLPAAYRELAAHALCAFLETCPACGDDLVEGPPADCCGNTVPAMGEDPPDVLACPNCGVVFSTFE